MKLRITEKVNFSQRIWNGANPEEMFWFDGHIFFGQIGEMGQILP